MTNFSPATTAPRKNAGARSQPFQYCRRWLAIPFFIMFILAGSRSLSQSSHLGSWNVINTKLNLSKKWSVFNELQLRAQSFYHEQYYYEVKGGLSYSFTKNFSLLLGLGKYVTYTAEGNFTKPITANEFRLWQQFTINNYLQRFKFEHRYRIEQRWFSNGTYRNRFRYRFNAVVPLNHAKMGPGTFYLSAFDEVFLTNKAPYFERNRIFAGAGYQFSKSLTIQPGYLHQFDYKNGTRTAKDFFQLTAMIEFGAHKNPHEKIPGNVD
ncbi:MAG TPA: DUF2490 domain-containing protein [Chitinophagaceae bacterium]|nr:DUF2490 domain-containing protein [Chitinophagaceae bacterium]